MAIRRPPSLKVRALQWLAQREHSRQELRDKLLRKMHPEKRNYHSSQMPMTEAAIFPMLTGDLYVSLGEPIENTGAWVVRVYAKPFVDWIWGGCLLMALGGIVAATDRRYRRSSRRTESVAGETA